MNDDRKLWVIEDNEEPVITNLGEALVEAPAPGTMRPAPKRRPAPQITPRRHTPRPATAPRLRLHSAILLVLGYVLGPGALVLTRRGRRSGMWVGLALVSVVSVAAVTAGWLSFLRGEVPTVLLPILVLAGALTIATAATVWSHGLHLLLTAQRFPTKPWPEWLRNPWTALAAGLAAPGSALAIARRPRLAALTAWWTWPGVAALLLLVQAPVVWTNRDAFGRWGVGPETLEYALVVAVVMVAAAFTFWVSQALVGARTLALRGGRWQSSRGDWTGLGVAAAVVVLVVVVQPGPVANDLSDYATALADAEYRILPVGLNAAARRLDPGQVAYTVQAADLHAARGDLEKARGMRGDLQRRMRPYLGMLASAPEPVVAAEAAAPSIPWSGSLPSPQVRPARGVEPVPPADQPVSGPMTGPSSERPAVETRHLFGPVLTPEAETVSGQEAPADSLP